MHNRGNHCRTHTPRNYHDGRHQSLAFVLVIETGGAVVIIIVGLGPAAAPVVMAKVACFRKFV